MNKPVTIAQFDNPTDVQLLQLQNELGAFGIDYSVDGTDGKFGFDAQLTFNIKVFVDEVDCERAMAICKQVQNTGKTDSPSFCPQCDSSEIVELSYRPFLLFGGARKFKCNKCSYTWKPDQL